MSRDWPVIYRAADVGEADIVVHWLAERGIAAEVKDRHAASTLQFPQIVAPCGIEVCVMDRSQLDEAQSILADYLNQQDLERDAKSDEPVIAECEECGKSTTFPGDLRGRVENCKHCDAYIDVPE
ncbi:MAG TPA: DUF2007 domain-containing protein [Phycisphaerae bacterium]|nr:DUF2007 domain-containing protein [Phycisphaerae bacterium]